MNDCEHTFPSHTSLFTQQAGTAGANTRQCAPQHPLPSPIQQTIRKQIIINPLRMQPEPSITFAHPAGFREPHTAVAHRSQPPQPPQRPDGVLSTKLDTAPQTMHLNRQQQSTNTRNFRPTHRFGRQVHSRGACDWHRIKGAGARILFRG